MPEYSPYTVTKDEATLLVEILGRYRVDRDFAQPHFDRGKLNYLAYKFYVDPESHAYKYNPVSPLTYTLTEDIVSTIVNAFTEKSKYVDIVPRETMHLYKPEVNDEKVAKQLEKIVNMFFQDPETEFSSELLDFVKQAAIYGNTYSTITPRLKYKDGDFIYLGPRLDTRDYFDVFINKEASRFSKKRHVFLIESVTYEELLKRQKNNKYFNVEQLKNDNWVYEDPHDEIFTRLGNLSKYFGTGDVKSNIIQLYHYWVGRNVVTVASNRLIIQNSFKEIEINGTKYKIDPYPYDIWDGYTLFPIPKEHYGFGVGDISRGAQDDNNLFKRMRFENIELSLHKYFITDLTFDIDIDNLIAAPGNIIDAPPNSIQVLETRDITQSSYTETQMSKLEAQEAVGSQEISRGARSQRRQTATTDILLNRNALKKLNTAIQRLNNEWFRNQIIKTIIQIRTYMNQDEYERIVGEPDGGLYLLTTEEIGRFLDILPTATSIDLMREQQLSTFSNFVGQILQRPEVKAREVIKYGFELYNPHENPERFLNPEQPIMPNQSPELGGQGAGVPGQTPNNLPTAASSAPPPTPTGPNISQDQILQQVLQGNLQGY